MTTVRTRVLTAVAAVAVLAVPVVTAPSASAAATSTIIKTKSTTPSSIIVRSQPRPILPVSPRQASTARTLTALDAALVVVSDRINDAAVKGTVNPDAVEKLRANIAADRAVVATLGARLRASTSLTSILTVQRAARALRPANYGAALRYLVLAGGIEKSTGALDATLTSLQARIAAAPDGVDTAAATTAVNSARARTAATRAYLTRATGIITATRARTAPSDTAMSQTLSKGRLVLKMASVGTALAVRATDTALAAHSA